MLNGFCMCTWNACVCFVCGGLFACEMLCECALIALAARCVCRLYCLYCLHLVCICVYFLSVQTWAFLCVLCMHSVWCLCVFNCMYSSWYNLSTCMWPVHVYSCEILIFVEPQLCFQLIKCYFLPFVVPSCPHGCCAYRLDCCTMYSSMVWLKSWLTTVHHKATINVIKF